MPAPGSTGALANPRFLEALFASDVARNKRNTKAIDVGANQLAAGRVVKYTEAHQLPLAEVKDKVRQQLVATQAAALAVKVGTERLAALRAAPAASMAGAGEIVSRAQPRDVQGALLDAVLKAPVTTLPAFVGVPLAGQGFAVVKIAKTWGRDPLVADPTKSMTQYAQVWADAEANAYYAALKARYKVSVNEAAIAPHDPAASEPR